MSYTFYMCANFIEIETAEGLEHLFAESHRAPIVIFKHSTTCGISAGVMREISAVKSDVHVIIMQTHRPLSNSLAERTGIRHESPQAIVIESGRPVYSASHYDIEPKKLEEVLAAGRGADD